MKFIHEIPLKLTRFLLCFLIIFIGSSCNESKSQSPFRSYKKIDIILDSGESIKTYIAHRDQEQRLGLSTVQPNEFNDDDAMLFTGEHFQARQFWMPETYFDLDLFFLGPDLKVLDIHRKLKHYTKREPRHKVPLSKVAYCQHVLELKASSPLSALIKKGMVLKLKSKESLQKILQDIH